MAVDTIRSITEVELKTEVSDGRVSGGRAIESPEGFLLVFIVAGRDYYLTSRRSPDMPRVYRTFELLTAKYRALYPAGTHSLQFEFRAPFEPKPSLKKSAKKKDSFTRAKARIHLTSAQR